MKEISTISLERMNNGAHFLYVSNILARAEAGKNGKLDPLKTEESDHLKFLLQKSVKLFIRNGV